jgi:N-acetylneuraminic acid mutarotase
MKATMRTTRYPAGRIALMVALGTVLGAPAGAQVVSKKPMPTPRMAAAAAVVNGRIYVIGGLSKQGGVLATVEEYDPATDAWATRAPMPTARGMLAAVAVAGTVYALGGRSGGVLSVVEAYDVKNDRWRSVAALPQGRWGLMAAEAAGKVVAIGGIKGTGAARQSVSSVDIFDPAKNTWSAGKQLPVAMQSAAAASHDGRIVVAGGRAGAGDAGSATNVVYFWRPEAGEWVKAPSLLETRTGAAAAVVGSRLIVVGGAAAGSPAVRLEMLDLAQPKSTWTRGPFTLSTPRTGHIAASVGGRLYVIGGATEQSTAGITGLVEEIVVR